MRVVRQAMVRGIGRTATIVAMAYLAGSYRDSRASRHTGARHSARISVLRQVLRQIRPSARSRAVAGALAQVAVRVVMLLGSLAMLSIAAFLISLPLGLAVSALCLFVLDWLAYPG